MTDAPPQLGEIPQRSELSVPTLQSNMNDTSTNGSLQNAKDTTYDCPVADHVRDQHAKTTSEFQNLADSRTRPNQTTVTDQPLTHYHSFFYNLLSWENPRATSIAFLSTVLFIFAGRYLPALRWSFKILSYALGLTASVELVGKLALGNGLVRTIRPKKYYTIPRETLEGSLEDFEQLINFFVIEFQRILFAENVTATTAAFFAAFLSYWLIKFTPLWGLTLIATSTIYLTPLIYKSNKDFIDTHLENASNVVNSQATQMKDLTAHHVGRYSETAKQYAGDYTSKAQNYIGSGRQSSLSKVNNSIPDSAPKKSEPGDAPAYQSSDFPHAPKQEPVSGAQSHQEQYQNSEFGGQAQPAM